MKQKDVIMAYQAIKNFSSREKNKMNASLKLNHGLFKIRKMLEPHFEFQQEQEKKIIESLNPKQQEDGSILFDTAEKKDIFVQKVTELSEMEVNLGEFVKPVIDLNEDVSISVDEMEALDKFVEFKE